jgi:NADP-dependent 3-hydroxy acid dehydrogenase YdfG
VSEAIEGKVVLITGGGTGLGAETARHLASKGAIVAIAARRRNKLDEVVAQITGAGGRASAYLLDVADKKQFKGVVDVVIADFGRLDVLINNAGLMPIRPMAEVNTDEWDAMINVNLRGNQSPQPNGVEPWPTANNTAPSCSSSTGTSSDPSRRPMLLGLMPTSPLTS